MKKTKKLIAAVLVLAIAIGVTKNLGMIKSKALEVDVKEQNVIEKVTCEEIRNMKTVEFEEYDLQNGDIRLISNKEDGSRIITEINNRYSIIKYYNRIGEEISCEYVDYKRFVSNNLRTILDPTYDKFGGIYFYDDTINEYLTIGCKAIYEINYYGLSAKQLIRIKEYTDAIDNINSSMEKAARAAGIGLVIFAPVIVYALAKYCEGMAVSVILSSCKVKFPVLIGVSDVALGNALSYVFGIEDDRKTMKKAYEDIKIWGKKVGTAKK